ncbi:neuroparsin-A-like [Anoplophora glabripennis]|uniref:neuroparsin-A-like n=1 Tax=Anoplophora glabripennis TaxID=217634 RepID=UPI000873D696|nr:neuroparsin-A-like [Anoplophora glabripennis]XP_018568085.1 neuroparsin-A-like [Anoplophora glabripennis]
MRSTLVTLLLAVAIALILLCDLSLAGKWVCRPCDSQAECDEDPPEYCVWGEVRDACNRRMCAKGPGERCGGTLNILGQCGEGLMCKSDEICHGCSIQTMKCYND